MEVEMVEGEGRVELEEEYETMKKKIRKCELEEIIEEKLKKEEDSPLAWAVELGKWVGNGNGNGMEVGELLVSQLCFTNNHPSLWKLLHHSLNSGLLSPLHVLSLLSSRVIPHRRSQPEAYRLFLELLSHHAFSFHPVPIPHPASQCQIIKSIDAALLLSLSYKVDVVEPGHVLVLFFFTIILALIDSTFDDWGLHMDSLFRPFPNSNHQDVDVPSRNPHRHFLCRDNSFMAIKVLLELTNTKKAIRLLHLVQFNLPEKFNGLLQRLQFFEANKFTSPNMMCANQLLERLSTNIQRVHASEFQLNKHRLLPIVVDIGSFKPASYCSSESCQSTCWVSFDMYMENVMEGKQLLIRSAIPILAETIKTLQVLNQASWEETFLALWLSALRLVQRERDPLEGPLPHLDSRLCILLTIVPLAIANILEDEASDSSSVQGAGASGNMEIGSRQSLAINGQNSRKHGLVSSLQILGQFCGLLCPPASVVDAANIAAAKAARFLFGYKNAKNDPIGGSYGDTSASASGGNMRHLIMEACIARNLIDTSTYFRPNYVSPSDISQSNVPPLQKSPWLTFMEGAPLDNSLINLLLATPASSLPEIEKLYHIALNGSIEEKSAAAKILCGASLSRGWNIQEHVVHYTVKLLSPPMPSTHVGQMSHLVDYMPMLGAILFGVSSVDNVHILSLHGVIPEVAGSLVPLCEAFGSLMPTSSSGLNSGDEPSVYKVFSCAFLFLLRLWKFYRPPLEQCLNEKGAFGPELSLEYILLLRNSHIPSHHTTSKDELNYNLVHCQHASNMPVYLDFYPKLRAWYCQNKSCIASPLSGLSTGDPVHEVANKVLNMIYSRITRSGGSSGNSSSISSNTLCGSPPSSGEDSYRIPMLPAWEVLEATPYVLEAILTACAHGRLSSRDLTTGLRDLIDFLPASIGGIISYFSAEITRGIWKSVPMNGTDWPSPAAILSSVESEMEAILATAGVKIPSHSSVLSTIMLPLPMAALVSLTITFKLNKGLDYIHAVVGPAIENCASACPWPTIPIIGSLWAQKVRRWHHFIVVSCARSVFRQNKEAVVQLLRSCFSSFLGSVNFSPSSLTSQNGVTSLLGNVIAVPGVRPSLAPGFLYLRSHRSMNEVQCVIDVIIALVAEYARESAMRVAGTDSCRLKCNQVSLSIAMVKAKEVAMLGASLLWVSGGMNLVQDLYRETIPTWLLSSREEKLGKASVVSYMMEGYAMAYLLILSGSFIWGVSDTSFPWALSKRARIVGAHMDFLARFLEGNLSLGCDPSTWKAYVSCFLSLVVNFAPAWIQGVKLETLKKLADGLKRWNENELALSLLERGGIAAMGSVAELINTIN